MPTTVSLLLMLCTYMSRLAPLAVEFVNRLAILVVARHFPGMWASLARSMRRGPNARA
jgi:integral membrane sensor domain MASE1